MKLRRLFFRHAAGLVLLSAGCAFEGAEQEDAVAAAENALTANGLSATLAYSSDWGGGYCADVSLTNVGTTPITTWEVLIDLRQSTMTSGWSATFATSGGQLVVRPLDWNKNLAVGAKTSFGFCANAPSASARPVIAAVSANGSGGGGTGGAATGGASTGGTSSGGSTTGGTASGGTSSGGTASGGTSSGGTSSGGTSSGGGTCSASYEAENATKSTGYAISGGWNLNGNGTISASHAFSSGNNRVTVAAKGDQANGAPKMRVSVGGQSLGEVDVSATAWTNYSFTYNAPSSGARTIEVAFTNDYYANGLDRNLHVDKVSVQCNATGGTGGSSGTGGSPSTGGTSGSGGTGGGSGGSGGGTACALPSSFRWTSSGSLAEPKSPSGRQWVSMKDFTVTRQNDNYLVYATVFNNVAAGQPEQGYQGVFLQFQDFAQMGAATQISKPGMVAPHLFYFAPKNIWVLAYQWGFKYATSTTPNNPSSWSATTNLLGNNPTVGDPEGTGPIDLSLICDDTSCYIFFAGDNGVIYRGSMAKGSFPGTFTNAAAILRDSKTALFEGVEVYKIKGQNKYLMIVEAAGDSRGVGGAAEWGARFFRAFTADSLGGTWTPMPMASSRATPFAGANNVTFPGGKWTDDISHGDLVREDPSEKKEIDLCNLRMLYQGRSPTGGEYNALPYRPGLLTLVR
jgi:hypothetical protein